MASRYARPVWPVANPAHTPAHARMSARTLAWLLDGPSKPKPDKITKRRLSVRWSLPIPVTMADDDSLKN